MATVIEFPQRPHPSATRDAALDEAIDQAAIACLNLGSQFERIVGDLEKNLIILTAALSNDQGNPSPQNAHKLAQIKGQLARARLLLETVRRDLRPGASLPGPSTQRP